MKIKKIKGKYYVEEEELRLSDVVMAYLCFLIAIIIPTIAITKESVDYILLLFSPFLLIFGIITLQPQKDFVEKKLVELLDKHLKEDEEDCDSK